VPAYVLLLLGSFTLSVAAGGLGALTQIYARTVATSDLEALAEAYWPSSGSGTGVAHACYRLFTFAKLLYVLAVALMVEVYNPLLAGSAVDGSGDDAARQSGVEKTATELYLLVIVAFGIGVNVYFTQLVSGVNHVEAGRAVKCCSGWAAVIAEALEQAATRAKSTVHEAAVATGLQHAPTPEAPESLQPAAAPAEPAESAESAEPAAESAVVLDDSGEEAQADTIVELCGPE
jgi:hypothetical protein